MSKVAPKTSLLKKLLYIGVLLPASLYVFDVYLGPTKHYKETPLGIHQTHLPADIAQDQNLLDPVTGKLALKGWSSTPGLVEKIYINYEDAKSVSTSYPGLNKLHFRNWNYFFISTPKHMIQFNFVDAISNGELGVCPSSIVLFEKSNPRDTMRKVEEQTFTCPVHDRHRLFDFANGVTLESGNGGKMKMTVTKVPNEKREYRIQIVEKTLNLDVDVIFDYDSSPEPVCSVPMSADSLSFFVTVKKPHMNAVGSYSYQGTKYPCANHGQCLVMMDNGRTQTPYGVAYYWVMFMTKLADGRLVTVNFGDGMGSGYDKLDQGTEDFIAIDQKYYHLDVMRMVSKDNKQHVAEKRFTNAKGSPTEKAMFPKNNCDLKFTPVIPDTQGSMVEDGVNLILIAFK
jgi:Protein of unknown function (DUF2804)